MESNAGGASLDAGSGIQAVEAMGRRRDVPPREDQSREATHFLTSPLGYRNGKAE